MTQIYFLIFYSVFSAFMLFSAYLGLFRPNRKTYYGIFCHIIANDNMVSYATQLVLTILTIGLLIYVQWYYMAVAVFVNTVLVICLELLRYHANHRVPAHSSESPHQ